MSLLPPESTRSGVATSVYPKDPRGFAVHTSGETWGDHTERPCGSGVDHRCKFSPEQGVPIHSFNVASGVPGHGSWLDAPIQVIQLPTGQRTSDGNSSAQPERPR